MRIFVAAMVMALLSVPVYSQQRTTNPKQHHPEQKADPDKRKVDDKAYNDALSRIPVTPDAKPDPWKNVR
jgi:hypothetical protein